MTTPPPQGWGTFTDLINAVNTLSALITQTNVYLAQIVTSTGQTASQLGGGINVHLL